jgi:hypothetical protein
MLLSSSSSLEAEMVIARQQYWAYATEPSEKSD